MDCVKRKNQNQKFRQPHVLFTVHDSTIHPPQRTEKYSSRRHAAIGLMPIEPFFTFKGPSSPPADDADREPKDEYADRERSDDPRSSTSRPPPDRAMRRSTPRRWRLEKKRFQERVGHPSIHPSVVHSSRVFERTRRSMHRVAHSSIAFDRVSGVTDVPA